jgi:hypothetical protein
MVKNRKIFTWDVHSKILFKSNLCDFKKKYLVWASDIEPARFHFYKNWIDSVRFQKHVPIPSLMNNSCLSLYQQLSSSSKIASYPFFGYSAEQRRITYVPWQFRFHCNSQYCQYTSLLCQRCRYFDRFLVATKTTYKLWIHWYIFYIY